MLRVSVVRDTLKARISARALVRSKPRSMAPPTVVAFRKLRRENSTKHLLTELQNRRYATQSLGCQVIDVAQTLLSVRRTDRSVCPTQFKPLEPLEETGAR